MCTVKEVFATKLHISIDIDSDYCNDMYIPSFTTVAACVFLVYMCHSIWIMTRLFTTLKCSSTPCYKSFLGINPILQLALFTAVNSNPIFNEALKIYSNENFDYWQEFERDFVLNIPLKTRRNGTLHMQVVLALQGEPLEWKTLKREGPTVIQTIVLTEFILPKEQTFSLLEADADPTPQDKPLSHIMSQVHIVLLTDEISLSHEDVPHEMAHLIRVNKNQQILPILKADYFNSRIKNLVRISENTTELTIKFHYKPIGIGKLRLMLMVEHAMKMFLTMGFTKRDADEVKGIFSDTNVYLLCATFLIGSVHILFDFLAFKNDVAFWRQKKSYEGLSTRTVLWRTFSQVVIFIYLLEENTSMLVIIPAGLGTLIEIWKCTKILKLNFSFRGPTKKLDGVTSIDWAVNKTEEFDKQGMKYLSYFLYPVCIAGAIYSLIYQPQKSLYSWILNSLVNGVYAFGFLLMLPQLFVNYKLKSVAALPWRAFMYKAFNTFIDDIFAFIITMPTAHRIACLRDDVVFIIYLYQRWLYPVDTKRVDSDLKYEENKEKKNCNKNNVYE